VDPSNPGALKNAAELLVKFECARCHDVPRIEPAPEEKHCVRCHQAIHAGTFESKRVHLDRWKSRITSIRWVPSLAGADRLKRSWVQAFLLAPHDVRPALVAQMPRLAITPAEAAQIAVYLVPDSIPAGTSIPAGATSIPAGATAPSVAAGEQLYRSLACARCHRFTGSSVDDVELHTTGRSQIGPLDGAWALAPDLRFARERMSVDSMAAWIAKPRGAMPDLGVSVESARALAAFIAETPISKPGARIATTAGSTPEGVSPTDGATPEPITPDRFDDSRVPARLPVLERAVTYAEVEKRVFRDVCWHCHAVPDFARGDGGPGNSGGFGFAPRGLDLSSYAGVASGSLDDRGTRRSVFGTVNGMPRIVAHLMARHVEDAGGSVDGVRGMPLGLPPLPLEEIQLVESWIAQGRPR
jgi:hypothetical protein